MKHFLLFLLVMLCTSCASTKPTWQEIPDRSKQFALKGGFSLALPEASGWSVNTQQDPSRLLLVKRNHDKDPYENYSIEAYVLNVPVFKSNEQFLQAAKEGQAINADPRYKILKQDINPHMRNGEYCALAHVVAEDHGQMPSFGFGIHRKPGHMIFEGLELTCRHTQNNRAAINMLFSLRYYPGEGDSLFSEKAMKVVDSVEFTAP